MASGVGTIKKTIIPCETAPSPTASRTGFRFNTDSDAKRSLKLCGAPFVGAGRFVSANGSKPTKESAASAAYAPASGTGASISFATMNI